MGRLIAGSEALAGRAPLRETRATQVPLVIGPLAHPARSPTGGDGGAADAAGAVGFGR